MTGGRRHAAVSTFFCVHFKVLELLLLRIWIGHVQGVSQGLLLSKGLAKKKSKTRKEKAVVNRWLPPFVDQGPGSTRGIQPEPWDLPWGRVCREREACVGVEEKRGKGRHVEPGASRGEGKGKGGMGPRVVIFFFLGFGHLRGFFFCFFVLLARFGS